MEELEAVMSRLTGKDAAAGCACAAQIAAESRSDARWYPYLDCFAPLLRHANSLVRNRALDILAANARWDTQRRYDALLDEILPHVTDEKPITARLCVQALPEIAAAQPHLAPRIRAALEQADVSAYRDSMQPLLVKDIVRALAQLPQGNGCEKR